MTALRLTLVFALLPVLFAADIPPAGDAAVIAWYSDIGQAFADAREKKFALLLLLEIPDQTWSRSLRDRLAEPEMAALLKDFVPVRLDMQKESQLLDQLVVRVVPDLRVFNVDGKQIAQTSGSVEADVLKKFLEGALKAQPELGAPSLSMLFPSSDLEPLLKLESGGKLPNAEELRKLMDQVAGRSGETRLEAQRLLQLWSRRLAPQLPAYLGEKTLKPRLAAFEALGALEAPLADYDPWSAPASPELIAKLAVWAKPLAEKAPELTAKKSAGLPTLSARERIQAEADLKALGGDDASRRDAAWQRLVGAGRGLVPLLREQGRGLVAQDPERALRYDELRFRLLLSAETLHKNPAAARKLAVGNPGARASALAAILESGSTDLSDLAREAACDRDPLFRETAISHLTQTVEAPDDTLSEALKDADTNVRVAALKVMAESASSGNAAAIAKYLADEPDADMIGHAVRALAEVKNDSSRRALRKLLADPRWQVRGAAVEALGKMEDQDAAPELAKLVVGDDGYVAGQAIAALGELGSSELNFETLSRAVKKYPSVTLVAIKVLGSGKLRKSGDADKLLRSFTKSEIPEIRAQALTSLASDTERPAFEEVAAALSDPATVVRTAAVESLRELVRSNTIKDLSDAGKPMPSGYLEVRDRVATMLKDPDATLRREAVETLCYFGDWKLCWPELKTLLTDPVETTRGHASAALRNLRGPQLLEAARLCLNDARNKRSQDEWQTLSRAVWGALDIPPADWKPDEPALQAQLEILPHLEAEHIGYFLDSIKRSAQRRNGNEDNFEKNQAKALVNVLDTWIAKLPKGIHAQALTVLRLKFAEFDDAALRKELKNENLEIRRMALAQLVRAQDLGPEDLVKQYLADPSPELRRLAVAAAIPEKWRQYNEDPTSVDLIAGKISSDSHSYNTLDMSKAPKVVQLPVETLEKLLKDDDEGVRVQTAYLMSLEGGDQGIPVLLKHMRGAKNPDMAAVVLIRAIIMAWSDDLTPALEEGIHLLQHEKYSNWYLEQLRPYIKHLDGPAMKILRAKLNKNIPKD